MKKLVVIEKCHQCRYYEVLGKYARCFYECNLEVNDNGKIIDEYRIINKLSEIFRGENNIPEWCELEDF